MGDVTPYAVKHGFTSIFGTDPVWWLTLIIVVGALAMGELAYRAVKRTLVAMGMWTWADLSRVRWKEAFSGCIRGQAPTVWTSQPKQNAEELSVEMWQEMEKDPEIRKMLMDLSRDGSSSSDLEEVEMADEHSRMRAA